ncbi:response regulator transcription factor [Sulfurimonas sp. NWX79]|uniref:response regulator transcription factor n=1 Tax=Sulfurimonas sp. NWX79 TaxID=2925412 RepID=UPI003204EE47
MSIILYSDDINLLAHWEKALENETYKSVDELYQLEDIENSIIITDYESCKRDCEKFLKVSRERDNRVLVLDRVPELNRAKRVLKFGAFGYGNALMRPHFILSALDALREGMIWLYPELTSQLILELPESEEKNNEIMLQKLTPREKEVALLLKEGLTYNEIAERLDISARTVKAHAQATYHKLDVKDRLGLALLLK